MSNRYSAAFSRVGTNVAASPVANLMNTTTSTRIEVVEIGVGIAIAPSTAPMFYIARATARGTQTATLAGLPADPANGTSAGTLDTLWSVNPTVATLAAGGLATGGLAVTAGGFFVFTFYDNPIIIDRTVASGLCLANANASGATTGTFAGYFKWNQ